jgi:hypothetical protein
VYLHAELPCKTRARRSLLGYTLVGAAGTLGTARIATLQRVHAWARDVLYAMLRNGTHYRHPIRTQAPLWTIAGYRSAAAH